MEQDTPAAEQPATEQSTPMESVIPASDHPNADQLAPMEPAEPENQSEKKQHPPSRKRGTKGKYHIL